MEDVLILLLLGIIASFMPLVFGLEIAMLGGKNGAKKSSSLVGGVTSFRVLLAIVVSLVFTAGATGVGQRVSNIADFLRSTVAQLRVGVTSGQYIILDVLMAAVGVLLILYAIRYLRGRSNEVKPSDDISAELQDSKAKESGIAGIFGLGFIMAGTNVIQWACMTAGTGQILTMFERAPQRLLAFILFLAVASMVILLPPIIVLVRQQQTQGILGKINGWIQSAFRYVVAAVLFFIGLTFIALSVIGIAQSFNI